MPRTERFARQKPRITTYDSSRIANPTSSIRSFGSSITSSAIWIARPTNSNHSIRKRSRRAVRSFPSSRRPPRPPARSSPRRRSPHHGTDDHDPTTGILPRVYELRSANEGTVIRVEVDEGQMVAEDDEIAVLDTDSGRVVIATDVPGVVRELYVEAGYPVTPGNVVALIDES